MAKSTRISTRCEPTQQSRRIGGAGGSSQTVPYRKQSKRSDRTANALQRVTQTLGIDEVARLRELWNRLGNVEREHAQADGIIMALIKRGLSQIEILSLLKIGGPRFQRIAAAVEEGASLETFGTRRERPTPKHATTQEDLNAIHAQALSFSLEDGFPCSHRRPIQYFTDPATTWMGLHAEYATVQQAIGARVLSQSRWRQYIGFFYPGLRLTRSKEDACNACVCLDVQLQRDDHLADERTRLELEKAMHLNAAIEQRRFVSKFAKDYISRTAPEQTVSEIISLGAAHPSDPLLSTLASSLALRQADAHLVRSFGCSTVRTCLSTSTPYIIIDDVLQELPSTEGRHLEGASIEAVATAQATPRSPRIQMQIEDYGGSFALSHYGYERPSADYFQSNLMMQNFIIADLTSGVDRVVLYDECGQGKGADALCSLRLRHHLVIAKQDSPPEILFVVLDNCVGQNKSQCVFQFYAALSLLFYKKIVLVFLLPGHSHNQADRVVAHCRNAMRKQNVYDPATLVKLWNGVRSVKAEFLNHTDADRPFYTGWEPLLSNGICTMRHLCSTPDAESTTIALVHPENVSGVRRAMVKELWGDAIESLENVSITALKLVRTPNITLANKKLESLAKKYFSIPPEFLPYCPAVAADLRALSEDEDKLPARSHKKNKWYDDVKLKVATGVTPPKMVGRPKKQARAVPNQPSILTCFPSKGL